MSIQNIGVIGVGGVGGYFGGKLCRLLREGGGVTVSFVARGEHLRAIQESGLRLSSEEDGDQVCQPSLATDDVRDLPPLDLCLVCVKEFDLTAVLSRLEPRLSDRSIVLPLLNGVDVHSRVRAVIRKGIVLPACVYVGTHIGRPGEVIQRGGACRILFGPDPERPDFSPDAVVGLFDRAGIKSTCTPEIQTEIWKKFIFISAFGLVSAASGKTLGVILEDGPLRGDVERVVMEAIALARGSGVPLPDDIAESSLSKARSFPFGTKTSFQRDFERSDRKDERDLFAGSMVRIADRLGIAVPKTRELATVLAERKPVPLDAVT